MFSKNVSMLVTQSRCARTQKHVLDDCRAPALKNATDASFLIFSEPGWSLQEIFFLSSSVVSTVLQIFSGIV